jgi:hypothetical protein
MCCGVIFSFTKYDKDYGSGLSNLGKDVVSAVLVDIITKELLHLVQIKCHKCIPT